MYNVHLVKNYFFLLNLYLDTNYSGGSRISQTGEEYQAQRKRRQPVIWPNFVENCMKMKKIGTVEGIQNFTV